jgi:hypothetical protein
VVGVDRGVVRFATGPVGVVDAEVAIAAGTDGEAPVELWKIEQPLSVTAISAAAVSLPVMNGGRFTRRDSPQWSDVGQRPR